MADRKKFVFLYLNTGGGHRSASNVLNQCLHEADPDISVVQINAFSKNNYTGRFFFEKPYHFSLNTDPGFYSSFYRISRFRIIQSLVLFVLNPRIEKYLTEVFTKEKPTDIVIFHFLVVDAVKHVLKKTGINARIKVIVLDPFTCHNSWFYRPDTDYLVYSEAVRDYAIECGVSEKRVTVVPFLLGKKYRTLPTPEGISMLKKKHSLPEDRRVLLVTGGGEGLPNMVSIVRECIHRKEKFSICVVCGRDRIAMKEIELLISKEKAMHGSENIPDIHIFGFIDFMDELVKCCDCAVIKAGPSSLIEVLFQQKPVIICSFIYGQELGNVDFTVKNHAGVFIRKTSAIVDYVEKLFSDDLFYSSVQNNLKTLPLDTNCDRITDILLKT